MPKLDSCKWVQKVSGNALKHCFSNQKTKPGCSRLARSLHALLSCCPLLGSSPSAGTRQVFVIALGLSLLPGNRSLQKMQRGAPPGEHGRVAVVMIVRSRWCGAG
jgi:hypothetical protein